MTTAGKQHEDPRYGRFIGELARLDAGQLARLRRGLGGEGAYFLEGPILRAGFHEERYSQALYLTAGLYALVERAKPPGAGQERQEQPPEAPETATDDGAGAPRNASKSIGALMADLQQKRASGSIENRFLALLDADRDGLGYHLRQAVILLRTESLTPDWTRLARDIAYWGDKVRRTWARDFYRATAKAQAIHAKPAPTESEK